MEMITIVPLVASITMQMYVVSVPMLFNKNIVTHTFVPLIKCLTLLWMMLSCFTKSSTLGKSPHDTPLMPLLRRHPRNPNSLYSTRANWRSASRVHCKTAEHYGYGHSRAETRILLGKPCNADNR